MVMAGEWLGLRQLLLMQRTDKSLRYAGCQELTSFVNSISHFPPRDVQLGQDMEESKEERGKGKEQHETSVKFKETVSSMEGFLL